MSDFELVYESNGQKIGDGMRVTRVSQDGQRLEVLVDDKTERFSPIVAVLKEDVPIPAEPDPTPTPDPEPTPDPTPVQPNIANAQELSDALGSASAGDVFSLAPGVYGDFPSIPSGVTIEAADPSNRPEFSAMTIKTVSDITFRNIRFKYTYATGDGDHVNKFYVNACQNIKFLSCVFEGDYSETGEAKGRGLRLWGANKSVLIEGCEFMHWWKGLGLNGNGLTVRGCNIHDIRSDGINTGDGSNILIELNYIHDFALVGGDKDHRDMIQMIGLAIDIIIRNNFLDQGKGRYAQGVWTDNNKVDEGVTVKDNIFIMSHSNCLALIHILRAIIEGNRLAQWRDEQGNPRLDNNPGIAIPKINIAGDIISFAGNVAPGIINPSAYDPSNQIKVLDDKALRAEAQADPRWSHFFSQEQKIPAAPVVQEGSRVNGPDELVNALGKGEPLSLAPGDYGVMPQLNSGDQLSAADPAQMPVFSQVMLNGVDGVSLSGLHLKYSLQDGGNHGFTANRFAVENCNDITLDGLIIEGDRLPSGNANGRGLKINASARVSLLNSEIFAFWSGISAHTMDDLTISGCNIHSMLSDGIKLGRINGALISLNYIHDFEHDPATGNHPDMVQIMRSSSDGCTGLKFHDNLFDMNKSGDAEIWAQTLTANQDKADLDNPAHQLHDIEYLRNVVIANQQHACTMVGVASGVFADNRFAAIPRPSAANAGAAIPKMRISGSPSITMTGNTGPGVINLNGQPVSGNSPDTPLDYLAERAAARRDSRWSHFFS